MLSAFVFTYEFAGHLLGLFGVNNLWLYNFANFVWVLCTCIFYYYLLATTQHKKWVIILSIIYLTGNAWLTFGYTFQSHALNTQGIIFGSLVIILFSFLYLLEQSSSETTEPLTRNPCYYFCIAFICIHIVIIFINGMYNFLYSNYRSHAMVAFMIYFPVAGSVVFNFLVSKGFVCYLRNTKSGE